MQNILDNLSSTEQKNTNMILSTIKESSIPKNALLVIVPNEKSCSQLWNKNNIIISVIILIVGFILGALIF